MNKNYILVSQYQIKGDKNNSFWEGLNIFLNIFIFLGLPASPSVFGYARKKQPLSVKIKKII